MKSLRASSALATHLAHATPRALALLHHQSRRSFLTNPFAPGIQSLTASRLLPYPSTALYDIISDVSSYTLFVPFCLSSTVTKRSGPDAHLSRTWPEEAELAVGFSSDIREAFHSRVYCDPAGLVVEAVSGATDTTLAPEAIAHHSPRPAERAQDPARNDAVLTHLLTRWTLSPFPYKPAAGEGQRAPAARDQTEVRLAIEFQFANPVYAALSQAAAPRVAEKMIQAFETRVREVLGDRELGGTR